MTDWTSKYIETKAVFSSLSQSAINLNSENVSKAEKNGFETVPVKSGEPHGGVCPRRVKALRSDSFLRGGRPDLLN